MPPQKAWKQLFFGGMSVCTCVWPHLVPLRTSDDDQTLGSLLAGLEGPLVMPGISQPATRKANASPLYCISIPIILFFLVPALDFGATRRTASERGSQNPLSLLGFCAL